MDTETRCHTAAGPAVLWAVRFEVERAFGRARADENHDQIGRINRQVMDSCVILVGRTPCSLSHLSLTLLHPLDLQRVYGRELSTRSTILVFCLLVFMQEGVEPGSDFNASEAPITINHLPANTAGLVSISVMAKR